MSTIEQLARDAFRDAESGMSEHDARIVAADLHAGEWIVAMISLVEMAPSMVSRDDVDELERLARTFDEIDGPIARRVIAKWRRSSLLSA